MISSNYLTSANKLKFSMKFLPNFRTVIPNIDSPFGFEAKEYELNFILGNSM